MPRRHSLDIQPEPLAPDPSPSGQHTADYTIAALALLVSSLLGAAGVLNGGNAVLLTVAILLVAMPPVAMLILAVRGRTTRKRRASGPAPAPRSAWDDSVPDPLTGIPVLADFERELGRVLRRGEPDLTILRLALVPVGGTAAHADLRRRLVLAAVNWQEVLRPGDRLARVADDRFAVLLHDCTLSAASRVIDRLRDATPPGSVCAVGAATWDGAESARSLLARAAEALEATPQLQGGDVLRDPSRLEAVRLTDIVAARRTGTFDKAAKSLAWLLQAPAITIAMVDDRFEHVIGAFGEDDPSRARASTVAEDALGHQCLVTGRPLVASDAARHPALHDHKLVVGGTVAACAAVPIMRPGGHIVGTISATSAERHAWTADELRVLRSTAARIAIELGRVPQPAAVAA